MAERTLYIGSTERPTRVIVDPVAVDHPVLAELLAGWRSKRGTDVAPQYVNFSPRDIAKHLSSAVVAEALPDYSDFRYRLVGSRVTRYFLSDATGKTIRAEFGGELGEFLIGLNQQVCREKTPIRLTGPAAVVDDVLFPDYDTLYLPWANGDVIDRIVSIFTFEQSNLDARQATALPPSYDALKVASADDLVRSRGSKRG